MSDEQAEVPEKVAVDMQLLATEVALFAKLAKCPQPAAVSAMGYIIRILNKVVSAAEALEFVNELVKNKTPADLDDNERMLCITLGILKRKTPFVAQASKIGRNAPCPCGSGDKYKNCCLELVKAHDTARYYSGGLKQ